MTTVMSMEFPLLQPTQSDIQNFVKNQPNNPYCPLGQLFLEEMK